MPPFQRVPYKYSCTAAMMISGSSFVRLNEKCSLPDKQVFIILLVYLKGSISIDISLQRFAVYR
jgi:hypothetical protein